MGEIGGTIQIDGPGKTNDTIATVVGTNGGAQILSASLARGASLAANLSRGEGIDSARGETTVEVSGSNPLSPTITPVETGLSTVLAGVQRQSKRVIRGSPRYDITEI